MRDMCHEVPISTNSNYYSEYFGCKKYWRLSVCWGQFRSLYIELFLNVAIYFIKKIVGLNAKFKIRCRKCTKCYIKRNYKGIKYLIQKVRV